MKINYGLLLLLTICQTSLAQNFNFIGSYTSNGTPEYLETPGDVISIETMELIDSSIPETFRVTDYNPHYISSGYDTDLVLNVQSEVFVTFVSEGAGFRNVLGYYTYDASNPPSTAPSEEEITIIFPNASAAGSGGGLRAGDKVSLGTFDAGTGIGWVLLSNAWNGSSVGYGYWRLFSNPAYNPENDPNLRQHNVLIHDDSNEIVILGFEDIHREASYCDHDFNDAVFYVTATNYNDITTTNLINSTTASDVYSSNAGGFESNGNLANLMAERSMDKIKNPNRPNKKKRQLAYQNRNFRSTDLGSFFPQTGMHGYESPFIATSEDLVNYANATDVFSVDYYVGDRRVSAGLVTTTQGEIYDHGKTTCDRLNNSKLMDLRTVRMRDHNLIFSILERDNGSTEYAISFSVKEGIDHNEIYSLWNIASYPDGNFRNFQIWGESMAQVSHVVNYILDKLEAEKPLLSSNDLPQIPEVFVKSAYYKNQKLHLEVINKSGATSAAISASMKKTEQSDFENFDATVQLSGEWFDHVEVETGFLFDVGLSFLADGSQVNDALYLADGPWGVDYQEENVSLDYFVINQQEESIIEGEGYYQTERSASMSGMVTGTINMFRTILPGDLTMNTENYEAVSFNITNNVPLEVSLVPADLANWEDRLTYQIPANSSATDIEIAFTDFTNANGENITPEELRTVIFSVSSGSSENMSFEVDVNSLAFIEVEQTTSVILSAENELKNNEIFNYPNPFTERTTFNIPVGSSQVQLMVYDLSGRMLSNQELKIGNDGRTAIFNNNILTRGMYRYVLQNQNNQKFTGSFLIE